MDYTRVRNKALEKLSTEETGGGLSAALLIFLSIVLIICGFLSFKTKFAQNNETFGLLIANNVILIIGVIIALIYGAHKVLVIKNSSNLPSNLPNNLTSTDASLLDL